jgi:hypothetical protein
MRIMLSACILLAAGAAHAQYKVSEIVSKGGQVMTAEQIRAELAGAQVTGTNEVGVQFELQLWPDGKLEGMAYSPRGSSGISGSWSINAKNQVCTDFVLVASRVSAKRCNWYWKADGEYYATNSRTDDEAAERFVDCLMSGGKDCDGGFSLSKRSVRK